LIKFASRQQELPSIRAIVLTCDRYRAFTEHMLLMYEYLWPNHPFRFRIPYQQISPLGIHIQPARIEAKKTPTAIRATMLTLLADLDDEEMIYWCVDDKYPIHLRLNYIQAILHWLTSVPDHDVDGILFCRCRRLWESNFLTGASIKDTNNSIYLERNGYEQIWIHQLLKVKVLRYFFEAMPTEIAMAEVMDEYKKGILKPSGHRLYVSRWNLARFGESTRRGLITANCLASMQRHGPKRAAINKQQVSKPAIIGSARDELMFESSRPRIGCFFSALASKCIL